MNTADPDSVQTIERFERLEVDPEHFSHVDHVRLAWCYLETEGLIEALARATRSIRSFAVHHGATGKYHETITWAYLLLTNERRQTLGRQSWDDFARSNPDLLTYRPSILDRYYQPETLASDLARRTFLLPDRRSLSAEEAGS